MFKRFQVGFGLIGFTVTTIVVVIWHVPVFDLWVTIIGNGLLSLGSFALGMFYTLTFVRIIQNAKWDRRFTVFSPLGRMALTNYLLQSVVFAFLFYGPGLGLIGTAGPALSTVIAIVLLIIQAVLSKYWLEKFNYGPVEWIWRSITYWRIQPLTKS